MFWKRVAMVSLCVLICFGSVTSSYKKAHAVGLALPAGIQIGAGAYVAGALAVGAVGGAIGWEKSDEIKKHASNVWDGATQVSKDMVNGAVDLAKNTGEKIWNWGQDTRDHLAMNMVGTIASTGAFARDYEDHITANPSVNVTFEEKSFPTNYPSVEVNRDGWGVDVSTINSPGNLLVITSGNYFVATNHLSWSFYNGDAGLNTNSNNVYATNATFYNHNSLFEVDSGHDIRFKGVADAIADIRTFTPQVIEENPVPEMMLEQIMKIHSEYNVFIASESTVDSIAESMTQVEQTIQETDSMYIPYDAIKPKGMNPDTSEEFALEWNPSLEAYENPATNEVYQGDVTWDTPIPQPYTNPTTGEKGMAVPGTYTDGIPTDWKDVYTGTDVTTGAIEGDIPTTGTAEGDGTTTGEGDGTTTGEGTGTGNPPYTVPEGKASLRLTPLLMSGELFKEKFPFSIPWDLQKQLGIFAAEPKTPVFSVDSHLFTIAGNEIRMDFDIDLSQFDVIASMSRWALLIAFDIGLILAIRKLMPS